MTNTIQEREAYISDRSAERIFEFLSRTKFLEVASDREGFSHWINGLDFSTFRDHLVRLNGLVRNISIGDRRTDGEKVQIGNAHGISYLPPDIENREDLLKLSFDRLKEMGDRRDAGLMLYLSLQAIHPFKDGNGRTGRLLFYIFEKNNESGPISSSEIGELIKHEGDSSPGRKEFERKVNNPEEIYGLVNRELVKDMFGPSFLNKYGQIYASMQSGSLYIPEELKIPSVDQAKLEQILAQGGMIRNPFGFNDIVLLKFLKNHNLLERYQFPERELHANQAISQEDVGKLSCSFDGEKVVEDLKPEYVPEIFSIHRKVKVDFVKKMINIVSRPQEFIMNNKPLKDQFYIGT